MNPNEPPKDHVEAHEPAERSGFDANIRNRATWQRLLFILILGLLFSLAVTVGTVVVMLQFFWVLFTGETKREFASIGRQLGDYGRQIVLYMSFNTDDRPFPFDLDWPSD
jgi:hypothetical protein